MWLVDDFLFFGQKLSYVAEEEVILSCLYTHTHTHTHTHWGYVLHMGFGDKEKCSVSPDNPSEQ